MTYYPSDWPEGCPPDNAEAGDYLVYRVVKSDPPAASDFETYFEMGKFVGEACKQRGVSVQLTWEGAVHMRGLYPDLGDHIAKGQLGATHGKLFPTAPRLSNRNGTASAHATWWPFANVSRHQLFGVSGGDDGVS